MLCEIEAMGNFWTTWLAMSVLGFTFVMGMSIPLFQYYYWKPTYETWRYKSNPKYPSPEKVREEIITMIKGLLTATILPALTLYFRHQGISQAYCGAPYGLGFEVGMFLFTWILSDFFEWFYHYLGHTVDFMWQQHKFHHKFYNPSPFAVIADEHIDQLCRTMPLLLFPILFPVNIDMLFLQYALFFYAYGVYLHWGFELPEPYPQWDHPWINTSFQHYLHHAVSIKNRPYHTGFFLKLWDQLAGSVYTGKACLSAAQQRAKGLRTRAEFDALPKRDYSPLLDYKFWMKHFTAEDPLADDDDEVQHNKEVSEAEQADATATKKQD